MSDLPKEAWWIAADDESYPPQAAPTAEPTAPGEWLATSTAFPDAAPPRNDVSNPAQEGWWLASDGQWYPPQTATAPPSLLPPAVALTPPPKHGNTTLGSINRGLSLTGKVLVSLLWAAGGAIAISQGAIAPALVAATYLAYLWILGGRWLIY